MRYRVQGVGRIKTPFFGNLALRDTLADEYEVHFKKVVRREENQVD